MTLRDFRPEQDYPAAAEVLSAAYPGYPFNAEGLRARDAREPEHCLRRRWIAEVDGRIVGVGSYGQRSDMYQPGRFEALAYVLPEYQGQGIGQALFQTVYDTIVALGATELQSFCQEDNARAVRFLTERGFTEMMRDGPAYLNLLTFDSEAWPESSPAGIRIESYEILTQNPDFAANLCTLQNTILADVPPIGVRTPLTLEDFIRQRMNAHDKLFEGSFAAVTESGDFVGCSELRKAADGTPGLAWVGLTGVLREWRGKGVALALKMAAIRWAKAAGYSSIRTGNASDNIPILNLNAQLGFLREPWRIVFFCKL
ncbi:MAG: GNAT family N-acetyltransferase [Armatimonas sp.]